MNTKFQAAARVTAIASFALLLPGCLSRITSPDLPTGSWESTSNLRGKALTPTMVRFSTYARPSNAFGLCASLAGEVTSVPCITGDLKVDTTISNDLTNSDYRVYSRTLDVAVGVEGGVTGGSVKGSASDHTIVKQMQILMEWARWRVQNASGGPATPYVSAVDVGVGVRIILDVTLTTTDANVAASFGIGSLATALATNSATVMVRYDVVGTTANLLPEVSPTTITTVDAYLQVMNAFYDAVRGLSIAYAEYASSAAHPPPGPNPPKPKNAELFTPGVLAYYVSNLPRVDIDDPAAWSMGYQRAAGAISGGTVCARFVKSAPTALSDARLEAFVAGATRAYSDFISTNRCDETAVDGEVVKKAREMLKRNVEP